jgi:hypothetical protein
MQSSTSISSLSSTTSSNSSTYGSRTILDAKDLHSAAPRCRSSIIVTFSDNDETLLSLPPPPCPPRRRSQLPSTKSMAKCRHLFRTCLSSTSSPLSLPTQTKLSNTAARQQYFTKLCRDHRLLLVLNDYHCQCGCHFSMQQGSFVILYETKGELSTSNKHELVTVISSELVCSKVPCGSLCDVDVLRERVRSRRLYNDEQSFDL